MDIFEMTIYAILFVFILAAVLALALLPYYLLYMFMLAMVRELTTPDHLRLIYKLNHWVY